MSDVPRTTIQPTGGPTALLHLGGLRFVVDPTFDPPGTYPLGPLVLEKTTGPALAVGDVGALDVALVSHDQHPDNLDRAGRALLRRVATVLTTSEGAERLGDGAVGLAPWDAVTVGEGARTVRVTAVPAQHGPPGSEEVSGPVIGFVLAAEGSPTVYVSGDNAAAEVVREVHERLGPFGVAVLNVGGAEVPLFDDPYVTLSNARAVDVARLLGAGTAVVALHHDGWGHFSEDAASLSAAFAQAGLCERLHVVAPGEVLAL